MSLATFTCTTSYSICQCIQCTTTTFRCFTRIIIIILFSLSTCLLFKLNYLFNYSTGLLEYYRRLLRIHKNTVYTYRTIDDFKTHFSFFEWWWSNNIREKGFRFQFFKIYILYLYFIGGSTNIKVVPMIYLFINMYLLDKNFVKNNLSLLYL